MPSASYPMQRLSLPVNSQLDLSKPTTVTTALTEGPQSRMPKTSMPRPQTVEWVKVSNFPDWKHRAVRVIAESFYNTPFFASTLRNTQHRYKALVSLYGAHVQRVKEDSWVLVDSNSETPQTVLGHATLHQSPFFGPLLGKGTTALAGKDVMRFRKLQARLRFTMRFVCAQEPELRPGKFWALETLCVAPEYQGQGIGTDALAALLNETEGSELPVFAMAETEESANIFENVGFRTFRKLQMECKDADGPMFVPLWFMLRPAVKSS